MMREHCKGDGYHGRPSGVGAEAEGGVHAVDSTYVCGGVKAGVFVPRVTIFGEWEARGEVCCILSVIKHLELRNL